MFAASKTDSVSGGAPDPQFNYVTMLLHGDGTNGAQNNTFLDSSTNAFSITRNGNTTQGSFSPYGSNWSNSFNGSTDYFSVTNATALQFGTGDFTIESWVYLNAFATSVAAVLSKRSGSAQDTTWAIDFAANTGDLRYRILNSTGGVITVSIGTVSLGTWTHIAVSKQSGTTRTYLNGVAGGTTTNSTSIDGSTNDLRIGTGDPGSSTIINGYISNARLVKGTAVYTAAFTPSTTPLTAISGTSLLTCQSNRFIDNSASPLTLTPTGTPSVQRFNPFGASTAYSTSVIGGSGYFDGTGDYLNAGNSSNIDNFTGDFCIEAWIYPTVSTDQSIIARWTTGNRAYIMYLTGTTNYIRIHYNDDTINLDSTTAVKLNSWNHVVANRSGSTLSLFLNGVSVSSATSSTAIGPNAIATLIGATESASPQAFFNGYITNVRIVKNSSVYGTSSFTPPTAPLTAITNTQLLLNTTNAAIFDNAMMNDLETVGNAQISTSVVKYGTGSLAFDGTGDYLTAPSNPAYNLGSGNFTIEFWVYPNTISIPNPDNESWLVARTDYTANTGWSVFQANQQIRFRIGNTGGTIATGNVITATTWQHIAVVRSGSTVSIYVNGTSQASGTNSSFTDASTVLVVGGITSTTGWNGDKPLNGYIDDLRITKGYARYTANFTPPTTAFSDTGPY